MGARWDPNAAEACLPPGTALLSKRGAPSTGLRDVSSKFWGAVATHQIDLKLHRATLEGSHMSKHFITGAARSVTNSVERLISHRC